MPPACDGEVAVPSSTASAGASSTDGKCSCASSEETCTNCRRRSSSSGLPSSSSSCSLLSLESYPVQDYDKLWRVFTASVKGFTIGAGLKGGLALFAILARLRRRRSLPSARKTEMVSGSDDVILALKETLRYGLFLGTFAGTFVSVDEIVAGLGGHRRTAKWRALLAGAIAGPSMLLTGTNTQHTSLAIYILMRAAVLASRCGIKSKRFGHICKPLTWAHGDIFLMCLSSSQILSAYILKPESLPQSYKSFLYKHGAKDARILQGVRDIACGFPFTNLDDIEKYYKSTGVDVKLDPRMKVPCSIIHGNQACEAHFLSFLVQAYKRALPVYLPVYLIPALIVHRQGLLKSPFSILAKGLLGTARSSLFLSTYCASAWMWTCFLFRLFKRCNVPMVALGTVWPLSSPVPFFRFSCLYS
ncbi:OLC1v1017420C2 [Oldenlandia corymbosa var. corymbosa]|uniref:OLC1v1017420C2 n=1 Tax=Oldenlandia corymbosa var. corymbosa TaxID=529605 RepID=A0AAV1E9B9_OLDCO|nr:OLC1v1017420C2 [Oldenlandia corymbosa var. corymbosa]